MKDDKEVTVTQEWIDKRIYYALTVQALHIYNQMTTLGGVDSFDFARDYLDSLGDYEMDVAKKEGITIHERR